MMAMEPTMLRTVKTLTKRLRNMLETRESFLQHIEHVNSFYLTWKQYPQQEAERQQVDFDTGLWRETTIRISTEVLWLVDHSLSPPGPAFTEALANMDRLLMDAVLRMDAMHATVRFWIDSAVCWLGSSTPLFAALKFLSEKMNGTLGCLMDFQREVQCSSAGACA
jgi:hypothetical protein